MMQTRPNTSPARRLWDWLAPPDSYEEEQRRIGLVVRFLGVCAFVGIVPLLFVQLGHGWILQV